jgi:soluble lytic murein transglycosylase-like protein
MTLLLKLLFVAPLLTSSLEKQTIGGNNSMDWKKLAKASPEELRKVKYDDLRLDAFANEVERKYNLPRDLLVAVKNAGERSNTGQVSEDKAEGVMQFIPSTRKLYPHDVNNPFASIDAAGRYFKDLMKMSKGNVKAAVAQYHGGTKERQAVMAGSEPSGPKTRAYWERMSTYMRERSKTWEDAPVAATTPPPVASASNVPKNEEPPVVAEQPAQPPTVMAVAPTQERVLPNDSGGSRLPSVAEK